MRLGCGHFRTERLSDRGGAGRARAGLARSHCGKPDHPAHFPQPSKPPTHPVDFPGSRKHTHSGVRSPTVAGRGAFLSRNRPPAMEPFSAIEQSGVCCKKAYCSFTSSNRVIISPQQVKALWKELAWAVGSYGETQFVFDVSPRRVFASRSSLICRNRSWSFFGSCSTEARWHSCVNSSVCSFTTLLGPEPACW